MSTVRINFPNGEGEMLAARLELPEERQPAAFAVFAHCFTCSKDLNAAVHISRTLANRGIAVLRFDFTGLGDSQGDFSRTTFTSEVRDLLAAASFLEREYQAPRLLVGHSLGGAAVLAAAVELPAVAAVVAIAAPFRPDHLQHLLGEAGEVIEREGQATVSIERRDFTIRRSLLDDLRSYDPAETLSRLRTPLLVLHSPKDEIVSLHNAEEIYRLAAGPKSFVTLDTANHLLSGSRDSRYAGEVIASWVGRYLGLEQEPEQEQESHRPLRLDVVDPRVTTRTSIESFRTDIIANGYQLVADEPTSYGGGDAGPSPYEYLMAALGACTGMTLGMYARSKGWPLREVVVRLSHRKLHAEDCKECTEQEPGYKIDQFERELDLRGELDEAQRARLVEIAERCPVHRTLSGEIRVVTVLKSLPTPG